MISTFHNHTNFCDGKNSPREMVEYAYSLGLEAIGLSGHANTPFDESYCMRDMKGYIMEVLSLKEEFKGKIDVYLGIEEDALSLTNRGDYGYIIGSSHYLLKDGAYYSLDSSKDHVRNALKAYNGNPIKLADDYYFNFCSYLKSRKPDVVGHFDLITKFEEMGESFFLKDERYLKLAERYLDSIIPLNLIFEVNVGAMLKGYRTTPYPSINLLSRLKKQEGKILLSGDCHRKEDLAYDYSLVVSLLKDIGFKSIYSLKDGVFTKEKL